MKRMGIIAISCSVIVVFAGSVIGQTEKGFAPAGSGSPPTQDERQGQRGQRGGKDHMGGGYGHSQGQREAMLVKIITMPRIAEELGITDEQITTIKKGVLSLREQMIDQEGELKKIGLRQVEKLSEDTVDEDAVMKLVETAGEIRTEIAKLQIKRILLLKKTLTKEQVENAREFMHKRIKQRMEKEGTSGEHADRGGKEGGGFGGRGGKEGGGFGGRGRKSDEGQRERGKPEGDIL